MTREDAFNLIRAERDYQDTTWPRDARRKAYYANSGPHVLLLLEYADRARKTWADAKTSLPTAQIIAKIATIAVRALEEINDIDSLLSSGLR